MERLNGKERGSSCIRDLTERERQCLQWAARGKTSWETATILAISESAVKKHLGAASLKLDAQTRTHAVAIALCTGLIEL